jgi:hypothetical protein
VATAVCSLGFGEQLQKQNSEANPLAVGGDDRMSKKLSAHWDRNAGRATPAAGSPAASPHKVADEAIKVTSPRSGGVPPHLDSEIDEASPAAEGAAGGAAPPDEAGQQGGEQAKGSPQPPTEPASVAPDATGAADGAAAAEIPRESALARGEI